MLFVKDDLMRVQHWLTAIFGIALWLSCGNEASAQVQQGFYQQPSGWSGSQGPFPQSIFYGSGPGNGEMVSEPAFFPDHQGGFIPSMSPLMVNPASQAGYQPGMQPWPAISPYQGPAYSELYNNNGMWQYDFNSNGRQYTGSVEFIRSRFKRPKGIVGHPHARDYKESTLRTISALGDPDLADRFQGDAPDPFFLGGVGIFPPEGIPGFNLFNTVDARIMGHPGSNGLRLRWGFQENDGTGVVIDGWWTGKGVVEFIGSDNTTRPPTDQAALIRLIDSALPVEFQTGDVIPFEQLNSLEPERILRNLQNLRGLPINDGTVFQLSDGTFFGGQSIPYDIRFDLKFKSQTAGTSVNVMMLPVVKKKNFRVTPLIGARYVYVNEQFNFFGEDSGLAYDNENVGDPITTILKLHSIPDGIDDDQNGIIDDAAGIEDPGQQQQQASDDGRWIRLDLLAEILGVEHLGHYEAFIENEVTSHLIGPEIGLQYEIGGKRVKLRGHTKFALLANFEKAKLKGNNIGNANLFGTDIDISDPTIPTFTSLGPVSDSQLITPTADEPNPNAFKDEVRQSHVSPLFEQSIFLDIPVFDYVPYLKRVALFDEAKLTLGWTFIFIAEVAKPTESILYNAAPRRDLFPTLEIKRGNWWTSNWSVGVEIPY